jgi:hypothetical protein
VHYGRSGLYMRCNRIDSLLDIRDSDRFVQDFPRFPSFSETLDVQIQFLSLQHTYSPRDHRLWRWRRRVSSKRPLVSNVRHNVMSQKTGHFMRTALRDSLKSHRWLIPHYSQPAPPQETGLSCMVQYLSRGYSRHRLDSRVADELERIWQEIVLA